MLLEVVFGGEKRNNIFYPIPFERILKNAHERSKVVGIADAPTDLTPAVVFDAIDSLTESMKVSKANQGTLYAKMLVRSFLSPKPLIMGLRLKKNVFEWVVEEVKRYFKEAIAPAGEMVGIIAAQSLGETQTQLTLDSFHVSGTAAAVKATSGVPRIKELLSVSKNMKTPSLTIYLKPDIGTVDNPTETDSEGIHADPRVREAKERAMQVLRSLETTRLENVIESTEIYYDPAGARAGFASTIPEDRHWLESYNEFAEIMPQCGGGAASPWVLRMRIHRAKLHAARLTMTDIYLRLMAGNPGITCLFSDDNARELVMRVSLNDNDSKQDASYDQVAALKALEQTLIHKPIKGMERIRKVSMHAKSQEQYNPATQGFDKQAIWVLDTDGSNLAEILGNPNVDNTRTISNDPREIYAVLGVEAARNSLYLEIMEVIKESSVNYRHVSLLIDTMTHRGNLMSIDRHGINRGDVGPLAKSSFEETTDMLINASVFSDYDKINGVSANIMLGQLPPCGTGDSEILLDEEMYLSMLSGRKELNVIKEEDEDESEAPAQDSGVCGYSSFQFNYKPIQKQNVGNAFRLPEVSF
jgi:DNA-directed RNA polymerase II subunit RPB1